MAKARNNLVVEGMAGTLGANLVLKRDRAGRTILARKPHFDPDRVFSPAQLARQALFRQAAAYAHGAWRQPVYTERAVGTPRTAYNLAIADWLHAPEILVVKLDDWNGRPGQIIRVLADDDVLVTRVTVEITGADGTLVEQGSAVRAAGLWWEYTSTRAAGPGARIGISAWDLPGHEGKRIVAA